MKFFASLVFVGLACVASSFHLDQGGVSWEGTYSRSLYREVVVHQEDSGTSITLTVQWDDMLFWPQLRKISEFQIWYRAEYDCKWRKRGSIPNKPAYGEYRVRLSGFPSGKNYFIRLRAIDRDGFRVGLSHDIRAIAE